MASLCNRDAVHRALSLQDAHIGEAAAKILLPVSCHLHLVHCIISAGDQVIFLTVVCVSRKHRLLVPVLHKRGPDHINALLYMELSGKSVIIIDTVCNITALLGLQYQRSALDGMDASRIDLEEIPLLNRDLADELIPSPFPGSALPSAERIRSMLAAVCCHCFFSFS